MAIRTIVSPFAGLLKKLILTFLMESDISGRAFVFGPRSLRSYFRHRRTGVFFVLPHDVKHPLGSWAKVEKKDKRKRVFSKIYTYLHTR